MREARLRRFDADRLVELAVRRWGFALPATPVQQNENVVFRTGLNGRPVYFRFTPDPHRGLDQLKAELAFVRYLHAAGVPVAVPIAADGQWIHSFQSNGLSFHVCVFAEAPGERFTLRSIDQDESVVCKWGRLLGSIHAASARYRPPGVPRLRWDQDDVWLNAEQRLPPEETDARRELHRLEPWLSTLVELPTQFGLIHGDLCLANFHLRDGRLAAFDFDDGCYHWFAYDIVCALSPQITRPAAERVRLLSSFLDGYATAHPPPVISEDDFDRYLRWRGLYLFLLNLRDWDGPSANHPKRGFLNFLRGTFARPISWWANYARSPGEVLGSRSYRPERAAVAS